ncbi:hypothetical protein LVY72_20885 [Arthrobacter sp. I2-34]|uniref:ABM domain-containing protein n=1 Tax=Arthrobacter hankyongi TaxID=2904801 RepID=A0ABS9LCM5_9MICC|nr:hypothetical protein [Arthrobacter hankyongi]MCG2624351.1 hypothetical protein [Arthrobacter hankyongi]
MFARVSTYQGSQDTSSGPAADIVRRVLELPGCRGFYFMNGKGNGKSLSIAIYDTEEHLAASKETANKLRSEASSALTLEVLDVEEYEIVTSELND